MIKTSEIKTIVLSSLGAENVEYYRDTEDIVPAINKTIAWLFLLVNKQREADKRFNEAFSKLREIRIYQTNDKSMIAMENDIYTIDAVIPLPTCHPNSDKDEMVPDYPYASARRKDLIYLEGGKECSRTTSEGIAQIGQNPFAKGNPFQTCSGTLKNFALFTYIDTINLEQRKENEEEDTPLHTRDTVIKIFPKLENELTAVAVVINHPEITEISDTSFVMFPESLKPLVVEKVTQFISYQEGDAVDIMSITEKDMKTLFSLFLN